VILLEFLTLETEAITESETSAAVYQSTKRQSPEDQNFKDHRSDNP